MKQGNTLRETILEKIKSGSVQMRPKWHFVLKAGLMVSGVVVFGAALLYLSSFIFFILRQNGVWFTPIFGARGLRVFFMSLPWILIFAVFAFLFFLEVLVRKYSFSYRRPMLYSLFVLLFLVFFGGVIVSHLGVHQRLFQYAEERHLPFAGRMYREFGHQRFKNVHPGFFTTTTPDGFQIVNRDGEVFRVFVSRETRLPFGGNFREGERVIIFGERGGEGIRAFGIRGVEDEIGPPLPAHMKMKFFRP